MLPRTGADHIVVIMSGNFLERGVPAIIDKYTRTKMALTCAAECFHFAVLIHRSRLRERTYPNDIVECSCIGLYLITKDNTLAFQKRQCDTIIRIFVE